MSRMTREEAEDTLISLIIKTVFAIAGPFIIILGINMVGFPMAVTLKTYFGILLIFTGINSTKV